ncbi:S49 family peptidase [Hoeflea sp. TYP-13]|uniref:S49 family peptidase n=1 Tax=Hoeflea sp. TYP-13 TaxID=3230023 RepID=UPI0034C666F9
MLDIAQLISQFVRPISGHGASRHLWAIDKAGIRESLFAVDTLRGANAKPVEASRRGSRYGNGTFMTKVGSIAVVPVMGPLMARFNYSYWSYDEIIRDLRMAAADDTIDAVLLDVDSPGGMVANVEAASAEIAATAAIKPVFAHIGGIGASAAYWLAASASETVAAPTSLVGSVGCLIRYMDIEGIFTKMGARVVEVIAEQSPNKHLDPESDEGRAELQAIADNGAELFLKGLAESRGIDRDTLLADYGQGLVFTAREAFDRGLIDRIASFEETLADLADRAASPTGAASATAQIGQETIMADENTGTAPKAVPAQPVTVESLRADHGDLVATLEKDASESAQKAERDRVSGIMALSKPGREKIISEMIADGTSVAEASSKILAAIDAGELVSEACDKTPESVLEKMDKAAEGVTSSVSSTKPSKANDPEGWKAEWGASDKLKAEFVTSDDYVAFRNAESKGQVKIFKKSTAA